MDYISESITTSAIRLALFSTEFINGVFFNVRYPLEQYIVLSGRQSRPYDQYIALSKQPSIPEAS